MSIKTFLKTQAIKAFLNKNKKKPFDENYAEFYTLSEDAPINYNNSYYFTGHSKDGQSIIIRLGERASGNNEIWFAYRDLLDNDFICAHQVLTNQTLIETACLQAGEKWKIQYSGGVLQGVRTPENLWNNLKGTRVIPAVFDGEFTASNKIFEFSKHINTKAVAKILAAQQLDMPKLISFFNNQQVFYEQAGRLQGVLNLGGKKTEIDMPAIRNRAYGIKDLSKIKKHIGFYILTENNQTISIHLIDCQIGQVQIGYKSSDGKTVCLDRIISSDQIPIKDIIPISFEFLAKFLDGKKLVIKCQKETEFEFSYDDDGYIVLQSAAKFDINGAKARGIIHLGRNIALNG
jgi:hypothetical protein